MYFFSDIVKLLLFLQLNYTRNSNMKETVLRSYKDFNFIYHYEESTTYLLNNCLITNKPHVILNYDKNTLNNYKRPKGYKYLHVVLFSDFQRFEIFFFNSDNVFYKDRLLFIVNKIPEDWYFKGDGFESAGALIVYDYNEDTFYYVNYFSGNNSGLLHKINQKKNFDLELYANNYSNFQGYNFKIGYAEFSPYIYCAYVFYNLIHLRMDTRNYF